VTVPSCLRCGQLLLPEIVRQLGDGRRCPFCDAELKRDAKVDIAKLAPPRLPPPAPAARAKPPAARPDLPGVSPRMQTVATAPIVVPPSTARSNTAPAMAFARAPEPDTAPNLVSVPAPRALDDANPLPAQRLDFTLQPSQARRPWLAALRRRRWLVGAALGAVIVTIGLLAGRGPTASTRVSSLPAPSAVPPPAAALPSARTQPVTPVADRPDAPSDPGPAATGHAKRGARSHVVQRTHHQKRRAAHPNRNKQMRVAALENVAPKGREDQHAARASYERGNQRLLGGDTAAAISAYEEAVRSAPSLPSGYRGLGLAYEKKGQIAEAVRAFRQYLKLAPSSGDRDLVARRLRHLLRSGGEPDK
jgi:hypothetical protein